MTIAEALNILANADSYTKYNLASPYFLDREDGKVNVAFQSARADKHVWGLYQFSNPAELSAYITGMDAARAEAAFDAAQAASASVAPSTESNGSN